MSDAPSVPAPPGSDATRSPAAPLFCWLVIQLIALALAVSRVPLAARFPPPGEQFAIHIMLTTQIVASAMLFPFLLRDVVTSAMVALTAVPFIQLAGYLSATPMSRAALAALYVATWMATLAFLRPLVREREGKMLAIALALAWSVGMAIVWYVMAESRERPDMDWRTDALFGPVLGAIALVESSRIGAGPWLIATLVIATCASIVAQKRSVGRSGSTPAPL